MRQTPLRQLVDHRLQGSLQAYVSDRRSAGMSWRRISHDLLTATEVDISPETLRGWFKDIEAAA